ncbi:hypothetical protein J6590_069986 [Homalodisca vitripennis]|nr:hypothetical protein J6590_069986 [Homalodisca vitripennis]
MLVYGHNLLQDNAEIRLPPSAITEIRSLSSPSLQSSAPSQGVATETADCSKSWSPQIVVVNPVIRAEGNIVSQQK